MTKTNIDLSELLAMKAGWRFVRVVVALQLIMEVDVEALIGAS